MSEIECLRLSPIRDSSCVYTVAFNYTEIGISITFHEAGEYGSEIKTKVEIPNEQVIQLKDWLKEVINDY